jgi:transposase
MAKKGQVFQQYNLEIKQEAVRLYESEGMSYQSVAEKLGVKNNTQIKQWVKKHRKGESLERRNGQTNTAWRKGHPKTKFASVEEELAYVKAERDYLKKRYPNLHEECCEKKNGLK